MTPIFLVVGAPAVGKSTTSRALAALYPKSIYIPVDDVREMVVSGLALPGMDWGKDLVEQLSAARESVAHMAITYHKAGFAVVMDDFWDAISQLSEYGPLLSHPQMHKVILYPNQSAAHARNLQRSGPGGVREYLDGGIRMVYEHLNSVAADLERQGWLVLDTTHQSVAATADMLYERAAATGPAAAS